MRKQQRPRLSIQLRGFMKTQRLFLRKQCHRQWNILCVNRFLRLRRNRFLLQTLHNQKCGNMHRMRKHRCLPPSIQLCGFTKKHRMFLQKLRQRQLAAQKNIPQYHLNSLRTIYKWNVLHTNRLFQSRRSLFLPQTPRSPRCESIHRPQMHLCICPSIQLRKFMKDRRMFINCRQIALCVNWKHQ